MAPQVLSPPSDGEPHIEVKKEDDHTKPALTPPTSEGTKGNNDDDTSSELSDLEPEEPPKYEEDGAPVVEEPEEVVPDHYYGDGKIPVFRPVSHSQSSGIVFWYDGRLLTRAMDRL